MLSWMRNRISPPRGDNTRSPPHPLLLAHNEANGRQDNVAQTAESDRVPAATAYGEAQHHQDAHRHGSDISSGQTDSHMHAQETRSPTETYVKGVPTGTQDHRAPAASLTQSEGISAESHRNVDMANGTTASSAQTNSSTADPAMLASMAGIRANGTLTAHQTQTREQHEQATPSMAAMQHQAAERYTYLHNKLKTLHEKCGHAHVESKWAGPDNSSDATDTIEITLPKICPHYIAASAGPNKQLTISPTFGVDGGALFGLMRAKIMPICFGITCVPTVAPAERQQYADASMLAELRDIEVVAKGREICRGMSIQGTLVFPHEQKLEAVNINTNSHPHIDTSAWLTKQNIFKQLHQWKRAVLETREMESGAPIEWEDWVQTSEPVAPIDENDHEPFKKLAFAISWCEDVGSNSGEIRFQIHPENGRMRYIDSTNIISLAICLYDTHVYELVASGLSNLGADLKKSSNSGWGAKALAGHFVGSRAVRAVSPLLTAASSRFAGLNPRNLKAAQLILLCLTQAINQRIAYDSDGQSIAFRCFYYLLFPHKEEKGVKLDRWTRGFIHQMVQIFLEKRRTWLGIITNKDPVRTALEYVEEHFGEENSCLQNDEIIVRLAPRGKQWQRSTIDYKRQEPVPNKWSWADYFHPVARNIGQGVRHAHSLAKKAFFGDVQDTHRQR